MIPLLKWFVTPKGELAYNLKMTNKMNAQNKRQALSKNEPRIASLEIAKLTGKRHTDLLRSIRKQEVMWEKVNERKFTSVKYKDEKGELRPMYQLTKVECLYITSKFNDELRAKLVKRWYELEQSNMPKDLFGKNQGYPPLLPKRQHNRLTPTRLLDIMVDIAKIDNKEIRLSLTYKLGL